MLKTILDFIILALLKIDATISYFQIIQQVPLNTQLEYVKNNFRFHHSCFAQNQCNN